MLQITPVARTLVQPNLVGAPGNLRGQVRGLCRIGSMVCFLSRFVFHGQFLFYVFYYSHGLHIPSPEVRDFGNNLHGFNQKVFHKSGEPEFTQIKTVNIDRLVSALVLFEKELQR